MKGQELVSASRLHVDYAQARDDQYEWEMKRRHLMREERRQQQTRSNPPPSPPLIPHFTEAKALSISEEIKGKNDSIIVIYDDFNDYYLCINSNHSHI